MKILFAFALLASALFCKEELYINIPSNAPSGKTATSFGEKLKKLIDGAKSEINFAIYGLREQNEILEALKKAKGRGVKVIGVVDSDAKGGNYYSDTHLLYREFEIKDDGKSHIMHNKFFVIDGQKVWSGSANISDSCSGGYNANSVVVTDNKEVAALYKGEFEQMFYGGRFGKSKHRLTKKEIRTDESIISVFFSPSSDTYKDGIEALVKKARGSILVPIFFLTHKELSAELINASKRGVDIKIIIDASAANNRYSMHNELRKHKIAVKVENFGGKMHAKSMIVDGEYIVAGSMNFTKAGNDTNDENTMIIKNKTLAKKYEKVFYELWERIPDKYLYHDPAAEGKESIGSCSDGIDNDFDKKADSKDERCM